MAVHLLYRPAPTPSHSPAIANPSSSSTATAGPSHHHRHQAGPSSSPNVPTPVRRSARLLVPHPKSPSPTSSLTSSSSSSSKISHESTTTVTSSSSSLLKGKGKAKDVSGPLSSQPQSKSIPTVNSSHVVNTRKRARISEVSISQLPASQHVATASKKYHRRSVSAPDRNSSSNNSNGTAAASSQSKEDTGKQVTVDDASKTRRSKRQKLAQNAKVEEKEKRTRKEVRLEVEDLPTTTTVPIPAITAHGPVPTSTPIPTQPPPKTRAGKRKSLNCEEGQPSSVVLSPGAVSRAVGVEDPSCPRALKKKRLSNESFEVADTGPVPIVIPEPVVAPVAVAGVKTRRRLKKEEQDKEKKEVVDRKEVDEVQITAEEIPREDIFMKSKEEQAVAEEATVVTEGQSSLRPMNKSTKSKSKAKSISGKLPLLSSPLRSRLRSGKKLRSPSSSSSLSAVGSSVKAKVKSSGKRATVVKKVKKVIKIIGNRTRGQKGAQVTGDANEKQSERLREQAVSVQEKVEEKVAENIVMKELEVENVPALPVEPKKKEGSAAKTMSSIIARPRLMERLRPRTRASASMAVAEVTVPGVGIPSQSESHAESRVEDVVKGVEAHDQVQAQEKVAELTTESKLAEGASPSVGVSTTIIATTIAPSTAVPPSVTITAPTSSPSLTSTITSKIPRSPSNYPLVHSPLSPHVNEPEPAPGKDNTSASAKESANHAPSGTTTPPSSPPTFLHHRSSSPPLDAVDLGPLDALALGMPLLGSNSSTVNLPKGSTSGTTSVSGVSVNASRNTSRNSTPLSSPLSSPPVSPVLGPTASNTVALGTATSLNLNLSAAASSSAAASTSTSSPTSSSSTITPPPISPTTALFSTPISLPTLPDAAVLLRRHDQDQDTQAQNIVNSTVNASITPGEYTQQETVMPDLNMSMTASSSSSTLEMQMSIPQHQQSLPAIQVSMSVNGMMSIPMPISHNAHIQMQMQYLPMGMGDMGVNNMNMGMDMGLDIGLSQQHQHGLAIGLGMDVPGGNSNVGGAATAEDGSAMARVSESELGFGFHTPGDAGVGAFGFSGGNEGPVVNSDGQPDHQQQQQMYHHQQPGSNLLPPSQEQLHQQQLDQQAQQQQQQQQSSQTLSARQRRKLEFFDPNPLENPPRIDKDGSMWKTACKLRVWEITRRYTPDTIRTVVAQDAHDYYSSKGSFPLGYNRSSYLRKRRRNPSGDYPNGEEPGDDDFMSERIYPFELLDDDENMAGGGSYEWYDDEDWDDDDDDDEEDEETEEEELTPLQTLLKDAADKEAAAAATLAENGEKADEGTDEDAEGEMEVDIEAFSDPSFNAELSSPTSPDSPSPVSPGENFTSSFYIPPVQYSSSPPSPASSPQPEKSEYFDAVQDVQQPDPPVSEQEQQYTPPLQIHLPPANQSFFAPPSPILPLPPPRLDTIRVGYLRQSELGMKLTGRGTPADRARAAQWAAGWNPSDKASTCPILPSSKNLSPEKRKNEEEQRSGNLIAENEERSRPRLRLDSDNISSASSPSAESLPNAGTSVVAAFVEDQVHWDSFLASLDDKNCSILPPSSDAAATSADANNVNHLSLSLQPSPDPQSSSSSSVMEPSPGTSHQTNGTGVESRGLFEMGFAWFGGRTSSDSSPNQDIATDAGISAPGANMDMSVGSTSSGTSTLSFALG